MSIIADPPTHVDWFPDGDPLLPENLDLEIKPFLRELDPYQTYDLIYYPKNKLNARLIYKDADDNKVVEYIGEVQFNHFLEKQAFDALTGSLDFSEYSEVDFFTFSNINLNNENASADTVTSLATTRNALYAETIVSPLFYFTGEKMLVDRYVPNTHLDWAVNYSSVLFRVLKHYDWGNDNPYKGKEQNSIRAFDLIDLDLDADVELIFTFALSSEITLTYFKLVAGELQRAEIRINPFEKIDLSDYAPIAMYSVVINGGNEFDKNLIKIELQGKYLLYDEVMEDFDFEFSVPNSSKFNWFDRKSEKKMENYVPQTVYIGVKLEPNAQKYGSLWNIPIQDFYNTTKRYSAIINGLFVEAVPKIDLFLYTPATPDCWAIELDDAEQQSETNAERKIRYGTSKRPVTKNVRVGRISLNPFIGAGSLFFANNNYWGSQFEFTDITQGLIAVEIDNGNEYIKNEVYIAKERYEDFNWDTTFQTFNWTLERYTKYFENIWLTEWEKTLTQDLADKFNDRLNLSPNDPDYFVDGQTIKVNRIVPQGFVGLSTVDYCNNIVSDLPPPYFTGNWDDEFLSTLNLDETIMTSALFGSILIGTEKSTEELINEIDEKLWEYEFISEAEFEEGNNETPVDLIYVPYELKRG